MTFELRGSFEPYNFDFLLQRLELPIARDQFRLLFLRQRGGKGVGQTDFEAGLEVGGGIGGV